MKQFLLLIQFAVITQLATSQNWLTTGNSGLTSSNFLGTTDAQALRFKTNNQVSGIIEQALGSANTSLGFYTLRVNSGNNNAAFGYRAMWGNTSGRVNTAMGAYTLYNNTTGYSNTAFGFAALFGNKKLNNLVAVGDSALYNNNSGPGQNTAIGSKALYANFNGYYNTALGYQALYANSDGYINTAVGYQAMYRNTSGNSSTAVGNNALYNSLYGFNNSAVGSYALFFDSLGYINTAMGTQALYLNGDGNYNAAFGHQALTSNNTGSYNTSVGTFSLSTNTSGDHLTAVGYSTNVNAGTWSNSTALGFAASITGSNQVRIGNASITSIGGFANWSNISDGRVKKNIKENVPGLIFINKLKPLTYTLDLDEADRIIQAPKIKDKNGNDFQPSSKEVASRKAKEQIIYSGFIAQDVENAARELKYDFSGVDAAKNDKDLYGLRYAEFVVPLVKAVQELSIQNDELKTKNNLQDKTIDDLQKQITELKEMIIPGNMSGQSSINSIQLSGASLNQNIPNPYNHTTTINYTLPQTYAGAKIIITEKSGKILREITLPAGGPGVPGGSGSLKIDASTLSGGVYNYSLYVDGRLIDTKQMEHLK